MVRFGRRAINTEAVQECGGKSGETRVSVDEEETVQEPDTARAATRPAAAGSATQDSQKTKVRHMAVSDTACITLLLTLM